MLWVRQQPGGGSARKQGTGGGQGGATEHLPAKEFRGDQQCCLKNENQVASGA